MNGIPPLPRTPAHIAVFPGRKRLRRQWFYRVVAANGETVAQSEAYTTSTDARRGARTLCDLFAGGAYLPIVDVAA